MRMGKFTFSYRMLQRSAVVFLLCSGCGPGLYGFSKYYVPSDAEEPLDKQAREYPYGTVAAKPSEFKGQLIAWFGIVESVTKTEDGRFLVRLSHNKHLDRHLCENETDSSCRVTVNFRSSGGFSVLLDLLPEDTLPSLNRIQAGTLIRVFGRVRCHDDGKAEMQCEYDDREGILLDGVYYRQWPARYYVTTRAMSTMHR